MCGIAGYVSVNKSINKTKFNEMVDIVAYRGPDDRGVYMDEKVALGHRRLAIIDLSDDGHQPFVFQDRYVIVYNGEIYNYGELRNKLQEKGYVFRTKTDTEVLAAMYDCYGSECVQQFNGMWAFAIYDKKEECIFCSRDRFGIKPFYYFTNGEVLAFASEIKQLLIVMDQVQMNVSAVKRFIIKGSLEVSGETMFADIFRLPGGHNLIFDVKSNGMRIDKYYDLSAIKEVHCTYEDACGGFRSKFEQAVKLRLHADVPVGYCLSGGLDSSSIVCVADRICKHDNNEMKQYTISSCYREKECDEQEYIDEVAVHTKVKSLKTFPDANDLFQQLDNIIWHMDEPFSSTSIYAQWNVFHTAKENGLTVMLDGQGADEQLAGYSSFYSVLFAYYIKYGRIGRCYQEIKEYLRVKGIKDTSTMGLLLNACENALGIYKIKEKASTMLPADLKNKIKKINKRSNRHPSFSGKDIKDTIQRKRTYPISDHRQYILDSMQIGMQELLHYEDRNSMAHSIESRVPFLDYKLVEFIYSLPMEYKIYHGVTKSVLRDGLYGILPEKIRMRYDKLGFVTPENKWMKEHMQLFEKEFLEGCECIGKFMDTSGLLKWFYENQASWGRESYYIWRVVCVNRWIKIFGVE